MSGVRNLEYFSFVGGEKMGSLGSGAFAWVSAALPASVRLKRTGCWLSFSNEISCGSKRLPFDWLRMVLRGSFAFRAASVTSTC